MCKLGLLLQSSALWIARKEVREIVVVKGEL
jgi:hypothetical protein